MNKGLVMLAYFWLLDPQWVDGRKGLENPLVRAAWNFLGSKFTDNETIQAEEVIRYMFNRPSKTNEEYSQPCPGHAFYHSDCPECNKIRSILEEEKNKHDHEPEEK